MEVPELAYREYLQRQREEARWRRLRRFGSVSAARVELEGRELINFSTNDYLGLATHPELSRRAQEWTARWGTGVGASRLVCGNLEPFTLLEEQVATAKGYPAALILNSGFQANATILEALFDRKVLKTPPLVFTDRQIHASLHHGCAAAGVRQLRFRHNDLGHLEQLLASHAHRPGARFVITESIFSMEGDQLDLAGILELKQRFGFFLYLDEAHATGVVGPRGFGLAGAAPGAVDLVMGTFSKGLGGFGAYVAGSTAMIDYLINRCGGFIYSTALPPGVLGAISAALELVPTLEEGRARLRQHGELLREMVRAAGWGSGGSTTQIVPIIVGGESQVLALAQLMEEAGFLAVAIRPPTVAVGSCRLRISLSAAHSTLEVTRLAETLAGLAPRFAP